MGTGATTLAVCLDGGDEGMTIMVFARVNGVVHLHHEPFLPSALVVIALSYE